MTSLSIDSRIEIATKAANVAFYSATETKVAKSLDVYRSEVLLSDLPINNFVSKQAIVEYKAMALRAESAQTSVLVQTKGARAVFDPKLGPSGGWRCPTGTRYGGYITNRFGRGCGGGVARRIGRALEAAGRNIGQNAEAGEKRRLARRAARQKFRAERADIRQRYPRALGRAANRLADRIEQGGKKKKRPAKPSKRVVTATPPVKPPKRSKRGATPKQKPIAKRGNRVGRAFDRLADRIERGKKKKPSPRKQRAVGQVSTRTQPKPKPVPKKRPAAKPAPAPRPAPAPGGRRPAPRPAARPTPGSNPWGSGSEPDERSLRNVRNRFPRGGLPKKAYWRDENDRRAQNLTDVEKAELERRYKRYYDRNNDLNSRGQFVNDQLKKMVRPAAKKAPAKKVPAKKVPAKKVPAVNVPAPRPATPRPATPRPATPRPAGNAWGSGDEPTPQELDRARNFVTLAKNFRALVPAGEWSGIRDALDDLRNGNGGIPTTAWWRDFASGPEWRPFIRAMDNAFGKWYEPGKPMDQSRSNPEIGAMNQRGRFVNNAAVADRRGPTPRPPAKKVPAKKVPAKKVPAKKVPAGNVPNNKDSVFATNARKNKQFGVVSEQLGVGSFAVGKKIPDGANGITSQDKANEFVKNGGALDQIPSKYLGLAIETNSSETLDDPNTRFFQKEPDAGAMGYTRLYFERSTFDAAKGFPTNSPNAQGYVVKGQETGHDDHVREAMGWNMAVGHGINQEGAMLDGMVTGRSRWGGLKTMPASILPLATNFFEPGEVKQGNRAGDAKVFDQVPNRAFPQRLRHLLHNYMLGVGDRNGGNMYFATVNGKPYISVLDQSRAGEERNVNFRTYAMHDSVFGRFKDFMDTVPAADRDRYRQEMREVYDDMIRRSKEFLQNFDRNSFAAMHMEGIDAGTVSDVDKSILKNKLRDIFDNYKQKSEYMDSAAGRALLEQALTL